jgi:hypothetical protein
MPMEFKDSAFLKYRRFSSPGFKYSLAFHTLAKDDL